MGRNDLSPAEKDARHGDRLIEQAARIVAQVEHVALELPGRDLFRQTLESPFELIRRRRVELGDADVPDIVPLLPGVNGAYPNDVANQRNVERLGAALTDDRELDLA